MFQASFTSPVFYGGSVASGWPTPTDGYLVEEAERSMSNSLAQFKLADELGYDWVGLTEHHFGPFALTPNPTVFAGAMTQVVKRAKIALLEPNAEPGLTNRLLAPLVDEIWMTLTPSGAPKTITTGTPVRATFARELDQSAARVELGLGPAFTTIVVFGGSQGARSLNEAFVALARELPPQRQLLLVAGARDHADIAARLAGSARVRVVRYLDDPRAAYAAADLVVARAGASTLAELSATATPALLVPYPHATGDHQARNADVFARGGGARVLADRDLSPERLRAELAAALEPAALAALRAGARLSSKGDARAHVVARVKALSRPNYVRP